MAATTLPVSAIIKAKNVEEPKKKTREDWRKAKELEEARKAGTAPAAVDEEGKDINPHIPQYIAQAPWYFGAPGPTLKHQRPQPEKQREFSAIYDWFNRGVQTSTATRYRKGACTNCGAMTHEQKECMERPRKVGAKFTNDDIAADEFMQPDLALDYDGKRDRWNGYNPEEHKRIIEEYSKIEEAKRQLKAEKLKQDPVGEASNERNNDLDSDNDADEDKYVDDIDMPGTKVDSKQRITVRNLRIREDTAKYLRNLDPHSAYYDPKTRSMRDNPYKNTGKIPEEVQFAGDNFVRFTGDTQKHSIAQVFAWEAYEKGVDVHLLAEPTKLELLNQEFDKRKDQFKETIKNSVLDKYGGAEHLNGAPRELLLAQTESYVEYSRHGRVIKGLDKTVIRSKYEEDVYISNHTSVWGSYWKDGRWGYQCCFSHVKNSYCTGDTGKEIAREEEEDELIPAICAPVAEEEEEDDTATKSLLEQHQEKLQKKWQKRKEKKKKQKERKKAQRKSKASSSDSDSESDEEEEKKKKLKLALLAEDEHKRHADHLLSLDERKRPYNSMYEATIPTEEEMEAYYMKKRRDDDPMADFLGKT